MSAEASYVYLGRSKSCRQPDAQSLGVDVATEDGVDVSQHLGVFAGACMPKPEILPGHKMWAATRPPTAKTTHPLLHTQDLLKGMTAAHQEGLPKRNQLQRRLSGPRVGFTPK